MIQVETSPQSGGEILTKFICFEMPLIELFKYIMMFHPDFICEICNYILSVPSIFYLLKYLCFFHTSYGHKWWSIISIFWVIFAGVFSPPPCQVHAGLCSDAVNLMWKRGEKGWTKFPETFFILWKKSCTTWDVQSLVNNEINDQPQLVIAGFFPSTVWLDSKKPNLWPPWAVKNKTKPVIHGIFASGTAAGFCIATVALILEEVWELGSWMDLWPWKLWLL